MITATIVIHDPSELDDKSFIDCMKDILTRHRKNNVHIVLHFQETQETEKQTETKLNQILWELPIAESNMKNQ